MRYNIAPCIVLISIFVVSSCNILTGSAETNKGLTIKSSTASGVAAMDVLQNGKGIFILGIAKKPEQTESGYYNFYLAQIDQMGQLLWEKTYGSPEALNRPQEMIATSDNHLLLVGNTTKNFANKAVHRAMHVVKVDYSGNAIWEKNYLFNYDNEKAGDSWANAVIEVSDGYMIGGRYNTDIATHSGGA